MFKDLSVELEEILECYSFAKSMRIAAETALDKGSIGLSDELSKAFDHFMRVLVFESQINALKSCKKTDILREEKVAATAQSYNSESSQDIFKLQENKRKALEKAKGHLIRCSFDATEIYVLYHLEKIDNLYKKYSVEEIEVAIPNFYTEILPCSDKIKNRFMDAKNSKGEMVGVLDLLELKEIVKTTQDIWNKTNYKVTFPRIQQKKRQKTVKNILDKIAVPILIALIGALAGGVIGRFLF